MGFKFATAIPGWKHHGSRSSLKLHHIGSRLPVAFWMSDPRVEVIADAGVRNTVKTRDGKNKVPVI